MSIERKQVGARMSQIVVHGDTVYLAGQVAQDAAGEPAGAQMANILERIDGLLAEAGSGKSKQAAENLHGANFGHVHVLI